MKIFHLQFSSVIYLFSKLTTSYRKDPKANKDYEFCRWLIREIGVGGIPPSAFVSPPHAKLTENYARFAFCKKDETMDEAAKRLNKLKQYIK